MKTPITRRRAHANLDEGDGAGVDATPGSLLPYFLLLERFPATVRGRSPAGALLGEFLARRERFSAPQRPHQVEVLVLLRQFRCRVSQVNPYPRVGPRPQQPQRRIPVS